MSLSRMMDKLQDIRFALLSDIRIKEVDLRDIERVKSDDWFIQRFIQKRIVLGQDFTVDDIVEAVMKSLVWRKQFGINDIRTDLLPMELYDHGQSYYGFTADNQFITVTVARYRRHISGWNDVMLDYIIHGSEHFAKTFKQPIVSIVDCSGIGVKDLDIPFYMRLSPIMSKNFPSLVKKVIYHNLPQVVAPIFNAALRFIPKKYQSFTFISNDETLPQILGGIQNVPTILGGSLFLEKPPPPPGSRSIEEVGKERNISEKDIAKMREYMDSIEAGF